MADARTLVFFVTTSLVLVLALASVLAPIGPRISFYLHKSALLAAILAFSFRPIYSLKRPSAWSVAAVRAWAADLASTNNFQLCLQSCVLLMGQPVAAALVPALVCCAYQWATIASKLMAGHWLWARYGAGAFDKMQHHMARALVLVTTTEIATAAMLAVELLTRARHPLRLLLYCNYLRMRFRCQDDTVLRLKFTQGNTAFYHAQVWSLVGEKLAPVLRIPALQPGINFIKAWFTGSRS
mmetsp:Transcript_13268/g.25436  ORF Transcript_13268/g.25436 Transcript_13268/m.25436 type:complete len:240 (+) Transcript_13268:116-835(+)